VTHPSHRKNIQATIDAYKSDVDPTGHFVADGKLVRYKDLKPEMGPFFIPGPLNL